MRESYKKVTLKDVAKYANVSYASVSAVLNGKDGQSIRVGEATKKNILEAAKKLGYVPDVMARSLKKGKSSLIAVFTYEKLFPVQYLNEFYGFFMGIEEAAEKLGYDLLIVNRRPAVQDKSSRVLLADGAIIIGIHKDSDNIRSLARHRFPIVFVGRREIEGVPTRWITFDYQSVIHSLIAHIKPICDASLAFVQDALPVGEAAQDKSRFLREAARKATLTVADFCCGTDKYLSEIDFKAVCIHKVVILSRLKLIEPFEALCKKNNLALGRDIFTAVLEDDWSGTHANWTRWTDRRPELGSAAVSMLSSIIDANGSTPESDNQIPVKLELIAGETTGSM